VPPYEGDYVIGQKKVNVQVVYYVIDTVLETFWLILELVGGQVVLWACAFLMVIFNLAKGTFVWYGMIGLLQMFCLIFWFASLVTRLIYNFVNLEWLVTHYDVSTYSTVTFRDPVTITFSELNATEQFVWWEQYLLGNKRSMLYANIMMSVVLALHPITFPFSWFFLFQVPIQTLLDVIIYPIFPMYDTPYIPWTDYLLKAIQNSRDDNSSEEDSEEKSADKDAA